MSRHMFTPTSVATFGEGGILRLHFRKTGRHIAAFTLEQMCHLFYLKRVSDSEIKFKHNEQTAEQFVWLKATESCVCVCVCVWTSRWHSPGCFQKFILLVFTWVKTNIQIRAGCHRHCGLFSSDKLYVRTGVCVCFFSCVNVVWTLN